MRPKIAGRPWTKQEDELFIKLYPSHSNAYLVEYFHRTMSAVNNRAVKLRLRKDLTLYDYTAKRFQKGNKPHNKGRKREDYASEESIRKCAQTHFKRGECRKSNPNYREAGHEVLRAPDKRGHRYWWIKPANGLMMHKHRWLWEQAHGPIPEGHCVRFIDGNTENCVLENLCLVNRGQNLRANYDNLPQERKDAMLVKIREKRSASIRRDRLRLRWGLEPKGKIVKKAYK